MGLFGSLRKLAVNTILLPVSAAQDVFTLGGTITEEEVHTVSRAKKVYKALAETAKDIEKLGE
jgi:hypothetical protein